MHDDARTWGEAAEAEARRKWPLHGRFNLIFTDGPPPEGPAPDLDAAPVYILVAIWTPDLGPEVGFATLLWSRTEQVWTQFDEGLHEGDYLCDCPYRNDIIGWCAVPRIVLPPTRGLIEP